MFHKRNLISALFAAFMTATLAIAGAGPAAAQQGQGQAQGQSPSFTDGEVESFANAVQAIQEIRSQYQPQIQNAENKQEATAVQKKAQKEMIGAIQDEGLSIKKYTQISRAIPNNPQLVKRIQEHMQPAQQQQQSQ